MKQLLITAFDPFGGSDTNPSELAVALLPDRLGNFQITKCVVPTIYGLAAQKALEAAAACRPDVILCIGVAVGRDAVTPERVALNLQDARIPDNAGRQPRNTIGGHRRHKPFEPSPPNGLQALREMFHAQKEAAEPASHRRQQHKNVLHAKTLFLLSQNTGY